MKAAIHTSYGPPSVLHIAEVPRPTPRPNEVLISVHATTVNRTDCGFRKPDPFFIRLFSGIRRPRRQILGSEVAGEVVEVGSAVTRFAVGDRVFGAHGDRFGANAEYLCMAEDAALAAMPAGLTFEQAASMSDGFVIAISCLRAGKVRPGDRVLVYGASGSIGTAAVQIAKHMGAHVTAVCNTKTLDLVRSLGADEVIDYTTTDFTKNGQRYDVVFDAVGKLSYWKGRRSLVPRGPFIETDLGYLWQNPLIQLVTAIIPANRLKIPIPAYRQENVELLKELVEAGKYQPVIDRCYPLEEVVEATKYVETGQKTGNVVLTVSHGSAD